MHTACDTFYCLGSVCDLDDLCFRWTTYDNINGPGGTIYVVILGLAGPLMYPDQISRYSSPDIYTRSPMTAGPREEGCIYQANHECPWYNYCVTLLCTKHVWASAKQLKPYS